MSTQSGDREHQLILVRELRSATLEGIASARIDDRSGVNRALKRREKALKALWGFSAKEKLPPHTSELAENAEFQLNDDARPIMEETNMLEKQLLQFMTNGLGRLQQQNDTLSRGARAIGNIHSTVAGLRGKSRVDIQG